MQNKIKENTDTNDKEGYEENSKQKRKGWWSLNGQFVELSIIKRS